jgi:hypothetical protein
MKKAKVSAYNPALSEDTYADQGTENAFLIKEYGRFLQIYRCPAIVLRQLTTREVKRRGTKHALISKKDYTEALKLGSPDEADAAGIVARIVRYRLGLVPGATIFTPGGPINAVVTGPPPGFDPDIIHSLNNFTSSYTNQ